MDEFKSETLEQEMFQAVERNHRRAVLEEALREQEEPRGDAMPMWACVLWIVLMAALTAACMIYAAL